MYKLVTTNAHVIKTIRSIGICSKKLMFYVLVPIGIHEKIMFPRLRLYKSDKYLDFSKMFAQFPNRYKN